MFSGPNCGSWVRITTRITLPVTLDPRAFHDEITVM
jgi:hypothetical protein